MNLVSPDKTLKCPHCGSDYLHQERVWVFHRPNEDASIGLAVEIKGQIIEPGTMDENPSPRRDGMSIGFSCEACQSTPKLNIWQHKGQTMVNWAAAG